MYRSTAVSICSSLSSVFLSLRVSKYQNSKAPDSPIINCIILVISEHFVVNISIRNWEWGIILEWLRQSRNGISRCLSSPAHISQPFLLPPSVAPWTYFSSSICLNFLSIGRFQSTEVDRVSFFLCFCLGLFRFFFSFC